MDTASCILIVPTSAVPVYQNAEVWKEFNIVGGGILVNPISGNSGHGYTTGNGLYEGGGKSMATVTAVARPGCKFVNWTKNGIVVSTNSSYSFTVTEDVKLVANFEGGVGMVDKELSAVKIYPNPTTGELKITNEEFEIRNIEIFDITGRKLLSHISTMSPETTVNISHLPAGVYFVKISTKVGEIVKKVLKE